MPTKGTGRPASIRLITRLAGALPYPDARTFEEDISIGYRAKPGKSTIFSGKGRSGAAL
jgi:hypothetical protein